MTRSFLLWAGILLLAAAAIRVPLLSVRPMHTDEAVHAFKFGHLLETGEYAYDPLEYHGPSLHYISLIFARLAGKSAYPELTVSVLRAVPVFFGTLLVLLPFLFRDGIGRQAAIFASVFLAFSPAFVFYSRYYIHETLLVFFMGCFLGFLWRYIQSPNYLWALLIGLSAGLTAATKETSILAFGSALLSLLLVRTCPFLKPDQSPENPRLFRSAHILLAVVVFLGMWVLLFSAFGTNPQGLVESIRSYWLYPSHAGNIHIHAHSLWYYFDLLTWMEFFEPISWNEDGLVAFALLGFFVAFFGSENQRQRFPLLRFLALFTLILAILYSAIPYKTPWNVLPFLFGMALLAGVAADRFLGMASGKMEKTALAAVMLVFGVLSPLVQSVYLDTRFATASSNPYVYGHTGKDISSMAQKVDDVAEASGEGKGLYIQVFASGDDYWPWPWYLRGFSHMGYSNHVDPNQPAAALILASADMELDILNYLYKVPPPGQRDLYLPLFKQPMYLRPGVEWKGFIRKDLWDRAAASEQSNSSSLEKQIEDRQESYIEPIREDGQSGAIRFSHEAMATVFEVFIQHDDPEYASNAARAAFEEADRLESLLSRYISNSDVSRITDLKKDQSMIVSPETMDCLQIARRIYEQTSGTFDVTVGGLVELWKEGGIASQEVIQQRMQSVGMNLLVLDTEKMTVTAGADSIAVDLGGLGKGYAVKRMGRVLKEWKIEKALIHAGSSSVLALNAPAGKAGWEVRLSNPRQSGEEIQLLEMENEALSCSGLRRGTDMINPSTGKPVQDKTAVWVRGEDPVFCDGCSTAFMVMKLDAIERFSKNHPEIGILIMPAVRTDKGVLQFGRW